MRDGMAMQELVAQEPGGGRRKTGRWLRPIRLGIGASNCATRSAPSSNSCAAPSCGCARNSIRRMRRSEAADSAIRTQARHSGSSPKPGPGAAVAFGRRCENVSCCRSQRTRRGGARSAARRVGKWSHLARSSCPRLARPRTLFQGRGLRSRRSRLGRHARDRRADVRGRGPQPRSSRGSGRRSRASLARRTTSRSSPRPSVGGSRRC